MCGDGKEAYRDLELLRLQAQFRWCERKYDERRLWQTASLRDSDNFNQREENLRKRPVVIPEYERGDI